LSRSRTSSIDLHLDLAASPARGRRAALERTLREAIREGRLAPGSTLPSTRVLAGDLQLSRGTVVDAYAQLVAEGYLTARPGSVTAVADNAVPTPSQPAERPAPVARIDLRPGLLDLASTFPRAEWLRAERAVLRSAPDASFDYGDLRGAPELRTALAAYLGRARGVATTPERMVICAGFSHGLAMLLRTLRLAGVRRIGMEDPCLPAHRAIVADQGLEIAPIPVVADGISVDALEQSGADAVIVTPAHQYPTGFTMSSVRRIQLVQWAQRTRGLVIEDDYDGEFRYDRQPVGAVQGLDPEHIAYVGTTSKTLAPAVRIGWLALPPALVDPVITANQHGSAVPPALSQMTLAHLVDNGRLDRHLRRLRLNYRQRRDMLLHTLTEAAPTISITGIAAGLHVLADLSSAGTTEERVRSVAERHGIKLAYLTSHWHGPPATPMQGIVVGYARTPSPAFVDVINDLGGVLRAALAANDR
jgi:GntR family transcriptional regulator/MocR family aminotransferase